MARRNPYRYSPRFIRVWTIVLCTIVAVCPIAGIFVLASSDSPDPQPVGLALFVGGLVLPILIGAVLGGNAIARHGGWVGLLFFLGFAGVVVGPLTMTGWLTIAGAVALALSIVGFWVIGWKAKVPMWLQAPVVGSPRLYVRGSADPANGGDPSRDTVLPNELDGEHRSE